MCEDDGMDQTISGPFSLSYTRLVAMLAKQLTTFTNIDCSVHAISENTDDQKEDFLFEISDLLRALDYPDEKVLNESLDKRFSTVHSRQLVLNFLTSELMAEKLIAKNKAQSMTDDPKELAEELKQLMKCCGITENPAEITQSELFSKLTSKLRNKSSDLLLTSSVGQLSSEQWREVDLVNKALASEYSCRKAMVLKRLDVTIQSFLWSDHAKNRKDEIDQVYSKYRPSLSSKTEIEISDLLTANKDLLNIDKTSSEKRREKIQCSINKFKIGNVPDRGGRVTMQDAPAPDQPAFRSRQSDGRGRGRGGFQAGGSRGGFQTDGGRGGNRGAFQAGGGRGQHGGAGEFRGDMGWVDDKNANRGRGGQKSFYGADFRKQHGQGYNDNRSNQNAENSSNRYTDNSGNRYNDNRNNQYTNNRGNQSNPNYYQHDNRGQVKDNMGQNNEPMSYSTGGQRGRGNRGRGGYRGQRGNSAGPY